jgi:hypothetical protein
MTSDFVLLLRKTIFNLQLKLEGHLFSSPQSNLQCVEILKLVLVPRL